MRIWELTFVFRVHTLDTLLFCISHNHHTGSFHQHNMIVIWFLLCRFKKLHVRVEPVPALRGPCWLPLSSLGRVTPSPGSLPQRGTHLEIIHKPLSKSHKRNPQQSRKSCLHWGTRGFHGNGLASSQSVSSMSSDLPLSVCHKLQGSSSQEGGPNRLFFSLRYMLTLGSFPLL